MEKILSIIVPVYNTEQYLATCLDSLLNQDVSKEEYEILCINDGSTDGSLKALQEYAEKYENIIVIDKPNGGAAATRNLGIEKAQGKYIWFVDSDDWISRDCFGYIFDIIEQEKPGAIQIVLDWVKAEWNVKKNSTHVFKVQEAKYSIQEYNRSIIGVCDSIIKRDLIFKYNIRYFQGLAYGEDIFFMRDYYDALRLEREKTLDKYSIIHCTGATFYFYRQREESAMNTRWTKNREKYAQALLEMAKIEKERTQKEMPKWYIQQYTQWLYLLVYEYMMDWRPGLKADLKDTFLYLKEEGLYPIKLPKGMLKGKSFSSKIRHLIFRHKFLYKMYYKIMQKKYKKVGAI